MNKTVLVLGILFLLIGASVVSSTDNKVKDISIESPNLESEYNSEILSRSDIAYGYIADSGSSGYPEGPCYFPLDDPGNITSLAPTDSVYFLTFGLWTDEDRWFGIEYNSGIIWEIDPETGDMENIGGGGPGGGFSYNCVDEKVYRVSGSNIYCEGNVICTLSGNPDFLFDIAFDEGGTLYGWDYDNLWIIDLETCECTLVGPLGINFGYGQFDFDTDILYFITYDSTGKLYECDEDTAELTLIGNFEGGAYITCLAIPWECYDTPPVTTISFDPPQPDGENGWYVSDVTVTLEANDDIGVVATYYRINEGGLKIYTSPFNVSEEGDDVLIEYYSVDNAGNVEDVKSAYLDIDKTPPTMTVEWEVDKVGWREWFVYFTIKCVDNASGMDRLEIFINDGLQNVYTGPLWTYHFSLKIYGDLPLSFEFIGYDIAGNYAVVEVKDTDISYLNQIRDIFTQQCINPLVLRILERFPLFERFLNTIQGR
jgi:hypothetical protein